MSLIILQEIKYSDMMQKSVPHSPGRIINATLKQGTALPALPLKGPDGRGVTTSILRLLLQSRITKKVFS